jgi:hypothetical protein
MAVELLFDGLPLTGSPVNLVFGETDPPVLEDAVVSFVTTLPALSGAVTVRIAKVVSFTAVLPGLSGSVGVNYLSDTSRPTVGFAKAYFEDANGLQASKVGTWQDGLSTSAGPRVPYQDAARLHDSSLARFEDAARHTRRSAAGAFEDAIPLHRSTDAAFEDATRAARRTAVGAFEDAVRAHRSTDAAFEDALRGMRNWAAAYYEDARPYSAGWTDRFGQGATLDRWFSTRYEDAMRPPPGRSWYPPGPPDPPVCYEPSTDLVFSTAWTADGNLLFVCEYTEPGPEPGETVVVPVKEVYLVINSAVLVRVEDNEIIPPLAMSMSLDVDSWTWSFSARVPGEALPLLVPGSGGPVHVQATVNGTPYRFIVERLQRDRSFNSNVLAVSGRGRLAVLDAPYAPTQDFLNTGARTAQQLIDDILTDNGVPMGWGVTWQPVDWTVPAGVFSHQGNYISAINTVASAAGAYLQPHNTDQALSILLRYPTAPWDWGTVTPDFELPSALVTVEGIEWQERPAYNRVYVSGQQTGVLGRVTRAGTAGDMLAPTVVDALMVTEAAARQRGIPVLAETGRIASVTLRLPVLDETGIIRPGNMVRYVDGATTRMGLSRSVSVDIGLPTIWQSVVLETHE